MRTFKVLTIAVAAALGAAACSTPPVVNPQKKVDLKILEVTPSVVFIEGGDTITVTTENGCAPSAMTTAKVKEIAVQLTEIEPNKYTFAAPAIATTTPSAETLTITCSGKPYNEDTTAVYGNATATATITFDPTKCPEPTLKSYGPVGDRISVLAKMTVTFSRAMDPATITKETVFIQGVDGDVTYSESTNTATFTAKEQLKYNEPYTAVVKSENGVVSACGKALKTTVRPGGGAADPKQDSWTFTTRKEGEGNPWVGDISAAAGISTGGNYKLFSVTGQPTPVGEAYAGTPENHTYKLQSGFIYATQPPQQ